MTVMDPHEILLAARGLTDDRDRLLTADEPLAELHERCGGSIPGTLAIPELLDLVRQGRQMGLRIAREFSAFDGEEIISGFVRIHPLGDERGGGCEVLVENWQRSPMPQASSHQFSDRLDEIDRATAEVTARLDQRQRIQVLNVLAADAMALRDAAAAKPGQLWSDLVELRGVAHRQPLHWRLLDGAECTIPGSSRNWRVRLLPIGEGSAAPTGFELLLVADEPAGDQDHADEADDATSDAHTQLIGSALTPVLRQPIARIIANAGTIRSRLAGPLRAEYSDYAGNIATAGKHLSAMLDDLADLEVVEAPNFTTMREKVDLSEAARKAVEILGVRAQARQIRLILEQSDEACVAMAEFRRVLQILINVIGNAIAYSPDGTTVTVVLCRLDEASVAIDVIDEGPGIAPDQAARIFDKFERLGRDSDGGRDRGSGLGLYISRRLALALQGDLALVAGKGTSASKGAHFRLTLPAE